MKLIFLGPPGAGKGTVSKSVMEKYGICQISTGDIFRAAIKNGTELGKKVKSIIDSGKLVPDELTVDLVRDRLSQEDVKSGFILDGFPRTIQQAQALGEFESIDMVIDFEVPDKEILVKRISGRRTCSKCNAIYNAFFSPPKKDGICDACGGELFVRKDDEIESVRKRLEVYEAQTAPLVEYYRKLAILKKVDASAEESEVKTRVDSFLNDLSKI